MIPLLVGTALALAALSFVLYPLLGGDAVDSSEPALRPFAGPSDNEAVEALREIEFDRATGKLSDADYDSLKATYTQRAIVEMRSAGSAVCSRCGLRPEKNALFCSSCGDRLQPASGQ